ncbi:twin-arginine translocase subunit TatC [Nocardiopsis suaedae]|uniref:Sec-independent protein translocase protein TatC n=1 Tax=Nocardiopsis suaedae TaxID=3018444 RepID=A0ABT4TUP8_9ACTN|nr:twin-arginine translocase subunit TatC [Nocardiopsis suaedae]MDA2808435.1 twin-arginine translocase subunit TatC [Nocardiopsis suaedae]
MPLMDHLRELRSRVVKAALFIAVGVAAGFVVFGPVWDALQAPYCRLPQEVRDGGEGCDLIFTGIFDPFFLRFKVAIVVGLLIASPFWLYQLWAFVAPALRGREKRYTYYFVAAAVPLFLTGSGLAYYITGLALEVLFGFATEDMVAMITITNYLNYMILMILVFGFAFVTPLLVILLNLLGVVTHAGLAKWRRLIVFGIFVLSAMVTPAEPISMLALAVPLIVLFEIAELFCFLHDRRRGAAGADGLADDELSPLDDAEDAAEDDARR